MEIVLSFLSKYWYLVAWLVLEVVFGVLLLLKKGRSNEPLNFVIATLSRLVRFAENRYGSGRGADKKRYVMQCALHDYKEMTGLEVTKDSHVYKVISDMVEEILLTPQKKEE